MSRVLCGVATKKPVEIHYFNWDRYSKSNLFELKEWVKAFGDPVEGVLDIKGDVILVKTLEGSSYMLPDNYVIIRGVRGEYYPCEKKIFKETYIES